MTLPHVPEKHDADGLLAPADAAGFFRDRPPADVDAPSAVVRCFDGSLFDAAFAALD